MTRWIAYLLFALAPLLSLASTADARRTVLIIGNSDYEFVPALPNPVNDAADLSERFEALGYDVHLVVNASRAELLDSLRTFRSESLGAEHSIIYYAGHGVEIDRQNFVIPVDAELKADIDVEYEAVPLGLLVAAASGAKDLQLVVLDACRDNPFLEKMTRTVATRSIGRGLALYEPDGNSLVAYSAKEGTVALDGRGENSPYAQAFLEALSKPYIELGQFFREVTASVMETTGGAQQPFLYGSPGAEPIYFQPPEEPEPQPKVAAVNPDPARIDRASRDTLLAIDISFWESIRGSRQVSDFHDYLERFPEGQFSTLAKRRLAALTAPEAPQPTKPAPTNPEPSLSEPSAPEPRPIPKAAEPEPQDSEEVSLSRSQSRDLQARLNILGFDAGTEDGLIGPRTLRAVAAYRAKRDMGSDSRINRALLDQIGEDVSSSRLAAYRDRNRQTEPAAKAAPKQAAPQTTKPQTPAPQATAPSPTGNLSGFVGKTYCRKKGPYVENGQYFSDRPIRCYTILAISQNAMSYRETKRQQYGLPIETSVFTRPRSGSRTYSPIALPSSGTGQITAGGATYVASSIHR